MSSHLSERLAEFVLGELSISEMEQGHRHLKECPDCRREVEQFQRIHAMLKSSPDVEPQRRIIFEAEKPSFVPWVRRWLAPMAASAAVALAVVSFAPQREPQIVERVVQQPPSAPAAVQPVDYEKIISELRASEQAWLAGELSRQAATRTRELQRVRGELAWLQVYQERLGRDNLQNQASIQYLVAQK